MSIHDEKLHYMPHLTLRVGVLRFRSSKVSSLWEKIWRGDEYQIQVACDAAVGPTEFYTKPLTKKPNVQIDDVFTFVLPASFTENADERSDEIKLKVAIFKGNKRHDRDFIDASDFPLHKVFQRTLRLGPEQDPMKVDMEVEKVYRTNSDFRLSFNICEEEKQAVFRRKEHVFKGMQTLFPEDAKPKSVDEVPSISLLCSGGGYRSTIQFCGAMEALQETGIFDMVSYIGGLSGGAWYVLAAYAKQALDGEEAMKDFHREIKASMKNSLLVNAIVNLPNFLKYRKYAKAKEMEGQPVTFVDFYGYMVGKTFLGSDRLGIKISDLKKYSSSGDVPIPIATAIHARSKVSTAAFHADLEMTPWEVSMPHYGMNMEPQKFGSEWYQGDVVRLCPELPLHFLLGTTSSAFGILLKYYLGGETTETDSKFIADVRAHEFGRHSTKKYRKSRRKKVSSSAKSSTSSESNVTEVGGTRRSSCRSRNSVFSRTFSFRRRSTASVKSRDSHMSGASVRRSSSRKSRKNTDSADEWYDAVQALPTTVKTEIINEEKDSIKDLVKIEEESVRQFLPEDSKRVREHYSMADEDEENGNTVFIRNIITHRSMRTSVRPARQIADSGLGPSDNNQSNGVASLVGVQSGDENGKQNSAYLKGLLKNMSHHPLFTNREAVIDRTAKVLNFSRGFSGSYFPLNPDHRLPKDSSEFMKISPDDDVIMFVDPALINNVPTNSVLRADRNSDILIVCDATEYASDTDIDYLEIFIAENLANQQGLKFPKIDPNKLKDDPRGVIHIFEDEHDPECPVVIWFTLCNKEYKRLENVTIPTKRRGDETYRLPASEKFNDFPVFGPNSCYSTLNTQYTGLQFDRLKELMRFNINNHAEEIKQEICKKILQKRLARSLNHLEQ